LRGFPLSGRMLQPGNRTTKHPKSKNKVEALSKKNNTILILIADICN